MNTGSDALWSVADVLGIVPTPPDPVVAERLRSWWSIPRSFGCAAARVSDPWLVIAPGPEVYCPRCAEHRLAETRLCLYCSEPVNTGVDPLLVYEMKSVRVLARAHEECMEVSR